MSGSQDLADELEGRLVTFAVRVMKVADALPRTPAGKHVGGQLLRAGTAPAANYAEARSAESRPDFIHKLKLVLKELNETLVWLRIIALGELLTATRLDGVIDENQQLCKMISRSITTSKSRLTTGGRNNS